MRNLQHEFSDLDDVKRLSQQPAIQSGEPPIGAHLVTRRRWYTHHGLYVGAGRVIHYGGLAAGLHRGPVEEIPLERFARGHEFWIHEHGLASFDPNTVVTRARSRLGENHYRLLTNNCEHFSEWCISGRSHSTQVDRWLATPRKVCESATQAITHWVPPLRLMQARPKPDRSETTWQRERPTLFTVPAQTV